MPMPRPVPLPLLTEFLLRVTSDVFVAYERMTDGRIVYVEINRRGTEALGFRREDVLGRTNTQLVGAQGAAAIDPYVHRAFETRVEVKCDHELPVVIPGDSEGDDSWSVSTGDSAGSSDGIDSELVSGGHGLPASAASAAPERRAMRIFDTVYTFVTAEERAFVFGHCRDVTEQRASRRRAEQLQEQAERATRTKSLFLARMSHDLRTPLMGVLNTCDLLEATALNTDQCSLLKLVSSSADVLLTLANDITDLTRVEQGCVQVDVEPFDVKASLKDTIDFVAVRAKSASVELVYEFEGEGVAGVAAGDGIPRVLMQDTTRLKQVCYNLVLNAIKSTPPSGQVRLTCSRVAGQPAQVRKEGTCLPASLLLAREGKQGGQQGGQNSGGPSQAGVATASGVEVIWMAVDVRDNGCGIAPDAQERIFQPFTQGPSALRYGGDGTHTDAEHHEHITSEEHGTGLGLAISRGLCVALGGCLELVSSQPGVGSHFRATFPMRMPSEGVAHATVSGAVASPVSSGRSLDDEDFAQLRVLLADDHPVNQEIVKRLLRKVGVKHVTVVSDGDVAVEAAMDGVSSGTPFDLLLLDVCMPRMDGPKALNTIRGAIPAENFPLASMLTANAMEGDKDACFRRCQPDAYLTKPVRLSELVEVLDRAFKHGIEKRDKAL